MPRYEVEIWVLVEAEDAAAAFEDVRANYAVVHDPKNEITTHLVDMTVGEVVEFVREIDGN